MSRGGLGRETATAQRPKLCGADVFVRIAAPGDAREIAAVVRAAAVAGYAGLFPPDRPPPPIDEFVTDWRRRLADRANDVAVAVDRDEIRGVVAVAPDRDMPSGRLLEKLYVVPDGWASGVGSALHDTGVRSVLRDGGTGLHLWVLAGNERARRMYERRGWRLVPGRTATPEGAGIVEVLYELGLPGPSLWADGAVEIALARPRDAGEIMTLQRAAFLRDAQIYGDPFMASLTQTGDEIRDLIVAPEWIVLVARIGWRIVGSVRARLDGPTAHIGRLMTAPDVQGRGIGRALMATIETLLDVDEHRLHTGSRSEDNISFYRRLGYVLVDDPAVPADAVTLTKRARPSHEVT